MYIPPAFAETDLATLHDFVEQNSFGVLVSEAEGKPFASHLPFLLDRTAGPQGSLVGHVARANPQWQNLCTQTALAIFHGPHAYISPTWYESENVVPTWNYLAVHVYGRAAIIEDEASLLKIVQDSVATYEKNLPQPWSMDSSESFLKRLLPQIVGFRIEIDAIEGKFKLNQNHPIERREKVVTALRTQGGENSEAVADAVEQAMEATKRQRNGT